MRLKKFLATAAAVAISSTALIGLGAAPASAADGRQGYLKNVQVTGVNNAERTATISGTVESLPEVAGICTVKSHEIRERRDWVWYESMQVTGSTDTLQDPVGFNLPVRGLPVGNQAIEVALVRLYEPACLGRQFDVIDSAYLTVAINALPFSAQVDSVDHDQRSAVVSGRGTPGAEVQVWAQDPASEGAQPLSERVVVDANGEWSLEVTGLSDGENSLWVSHDYGGVQDVEKLDVVIQPQMVPVADPIIAGGFGVLLLAAGAVAVRRRVRA